MLLSITVVTSATQHIACEVALTLATKSNNNNNNNNNNDINIIL